MGNKTFIQLALYTTVGSVGTFFHYFLFLGFIFVFNLKPLFSSCIGYASGALVNYFLNYKFTFGSKKKHKEAMSKFFIIVFGGFWTNYVVMVIMNDVFLCNYLTSQIFSTFLVLVFGFIFNKHWTFKERRGVYGTQRSK